MLKAFVVYGLVLGAVLTLVLHEGSAPHSVTYFVYEGSSDGSIVPALKFDPPGIGWPWSLVIGHSIGLLAGPGMGLLLQRLGWRLSRTA